MTSYQILTIFPEYFDSFKSQGLVSRALADNKISIDTINFRDFAVNNQGGVDDTPFGGGSGMVLRPEPAVAAIKKAKENKPDAKVVLFSPRGEKITCLLYTSPSPRDRTRSRMPSSA